MKSITVELPGKSVIALEPIECSNLEELKALAPPNSPLAQAVQKFLEVNHVITAIRIVRMIAPKAGLSAAKRYVDILKYGEGYRV